MPYKDPQKQREHAKAWWRKNPEKKKAYDKKRWTWYKTFLKRQCFEAYGGVRCACPSGLCFETRLAFLTIDHINGGGSKHRRTQGRCPHEDGLFSE